MPNWKNLQPFTKTHSNKRLHLTAGTKNLQIFSNLCEEGLLLESQDFIYILQ